MKDVKALLPQINYRVPNMRFLKDKLQVGTLPRPSLRIPSRGLTSALLTQEVEARNDLTYPNFAQLYRTLMFDAQKTVSARTLRVFLFLPQSHSREEELKSFTFSLNSTSFHRFYLI